MLCSPYPALLTSLIDDYSLKAIVQALQEEYRRRQKEEPENEEHGKLAKLCSQFLILL